MTKKIKSSKVKQRGVLFTGTSNIVLPGNKASFPEAFRNSSRLHYYSSLFNSLEVNSSFFKIPLPATVKKWSLDVPDDFKFSIKLWRDITHNKELLFNPEDVNRFMQAAMAAGNRAGCMLIQLPGKITLDYFTQIEQLLECIALAGPQQLWRKAVEFRSNDWYTSETIELLNQHDTAMVLHDIDKGRNHEIRTDAAFVYCRYHGPAGDYRGNYGIDFLQSEAEKIKQWLSKGKDVYAYFNNTIGNAFQNAMALQSMVDV